MLRRLLSGSAIALALAGPALSQDDVLTPAQLDANRGGFLVAGELTFDFSAVVRTFENGALVLQSQVAWTPDGPVVDRIAASGVEVSTARNGGAAPGSSFTTPGGASLIQQVTGGELTNILLNTQSNRSFRQETDVTLVLPGFDGVQGDIGRSLSALRLADDLATGAISAVGR